MVVCQEHFQVVVQVTIIVLEIMAMQTLVVAVVVLQVGRTVLTVVQV
jgi:hypothetical protein